MMIEGSAAVAVAALLQREREFEGRKVGVVLCGGNLGMAALRRILAP